MPTWGNTDGANQKPKFDAARQTRDVIQLKLGTAATAGQPTINLAYNDGNQNNVANVGVAVGQYVYFYPNGFALPGGTTGNGYPGFFASNNTVLSISGNVVTLASNVFNAQTNGTGVEFDKAIVYNSNKTTEVNYNSDTILITPTRLANAVFANSVNYSNTALSTSGGAASHAGWNKVTTFTGGRQGRVQTECLVALANPTAANTLSGNTSNSQTYFSGL